MVLTMTVKRFILSRIISSIFLVVCTSIPLVAQRLTRDLNVEVLTNHIGFTPASPKFCIVKSASTVTFEVLDVATGEKVFTGNMQPSEGDFGMYAKGDFTNVKKEGRYYIKADTLRSYPFSISTKVYSPQIQMVLHYFSLQRCGASTTGYLTPCHVDDGIRFDNGKHQDVSGGWHDASDLRKWVSATIYGVLGLAKAYELADGSMHARILEEIRWGNQYFLKMQEPAGYVMDFVGGDLLKHSDNNRWTNNVVEKGDTSIRLVIPDKGLSKNPALVSGDVDDRIIQTQPVEFSAQYNFIAAQSLVSRITKTSNPAYSNKCLAAAKKCYAWCLQHDTDSLYINVGAALLATVELQKADKKNNYRGRIDEIVDLLKRLQVLENSGEASGFFVSKLGTAEPYKNIWNGCEALIGLCDLAKQFPVDRKLPEWKSIVSGYAANYLLQFSKKNHFGIIPFGLFAGDDPGGKRKIGKYWYRYFMQPEQEWWVGINANVASAGVGLLKASELLQNNEMKQAAQEQLDWVFGANPLNATTMVGAGYNNLKYFAGSSFVPNVPMIPGAVVNGIGGDHADMPVRGDGSWQTSEYWTPMVGYTLWLMNEIQAAN